MIMQRVLNLMVANKSPWLRLWNDQQGAVALIFVFFLNAMLIMLGLALDMGRGLETQSRMQNAATGAALAGAVEDGDQNEAVDYFVANFPNGQGGATYSPGDVQVDINGSTISVIPTNFVMQTFFPVNGSASANTLNVTSIAVAALPTGAPVPASLLLVLDRSGSMATGDAGPCPTTGQNPCSRIQALKEATIQLVNNLAALPNAANDYAIAGVPWASSVYNPFSYTNDFAQVVANFNQSLTAGGSTCAYCGLKQGNMYLPSSSFNKRVMVFMTDGYFNTLTYDWENDTPAGYPPDWTSGSLPNPHRAAAWKCHQAKLDYPTDLNIWTISFGGANPPGGENGAVLSYCASLPTQYIHAPNGQALAAVFGQVLQGISSVRLVQ